MNNLDDIPGTEIKFNEFPSIPRISANVLTIATRGNSRPVWVYSAGNDVEVIALFAGV